MSAKRGLSDRPTDFASVVGAHWRSSTAYLQAEREPCITIRDEEAQEIGQNRNLVRLGRGDLHRIDRDAVWILAVIVCPEDDVREVTEWVRMHDVEPRRIWFFLHGSTDMAVLQPWADAGFPTNQVDFADTWREMHPRLGLCLSDFIYEAKGPPHTRTWTPGRKP